MPGYLPLEISTADLLGLGFPVRTEQVFLHDQMTSGHAMTVWQPPDPLYAKYGDGQVIPSGLVLNDGSKLTLPMPLTFDDAEEWRVEEAFAHHGDLIAQWPTVIGRWTSPATLYEQEFAMHRIWDLWPITSYEHDHLIEAHERIWSELRISDVYLHDAVLEGDITFDEHFDPDFDHTKYAELLAAGDDKGTEAMAEAARDNWLYELQRCISDAEPNWEPKVVNELLDLHSVGLAGAWHDLKWVSKASWAKVFRLVDPSERLQYQLEQKVVNPWL